MGLLRILCPPKLPPGLAPPYPWFGGKAMVAPAVWAALGDVDNYVEPFFGGGAVYLLRPNPQGVETINDIDGFVANFWRAVKAEPEKVAEYADWPVNEVDLLARHRWLCRMPDKAEFLERMRADPDYHDAKRAGWWVWGISAWIGRGWCQGEWWPDGNSGKGIHRKSLAVRSQLPHLGDPGRGVHRKSLASVDGDGLLPVNRNIREYIAALSRRLRNTRVCCGDWSRVLTGGATAYGSRVGVFLDPPYSHSVGRDEAIYNAESPDVSGEVRQWCIDRSGDERFCIVLAGYEGEHDELERIGWRVVAWKAKGGYGNFGHGQAKDNRHRERLWLSPSCEAA